MGRREEIREGDKVKVKKGIHYEYRDWGNRICEVTGIKYDSHTELTIYIVKYNQGRGVFLASELKLFQRRSNGTPTV